MTLDLGTEPMASATDQPHSATALAQALLQAVQGHLDVDAAQAWAVQQARQLLSGGLSDAPAVAALPLSVLPAVVPVVAASVVPALRPLVLDEEAWEVTSNGLVLRITLTQYRLLGALLRADTRTVPTRHLATLMFGSAYRETERVAAHVRRLRRRLVEEEVDGCSLDTVRGVGYRLTWTS
jgi:DNA-binding response OmpR family regulator